MLSPTIHTLQEKSQKNSLKFVFKRYCPEYGCSAIPEQNRVALLFAHCVGAHKETWEPTIERIFGRQAILSLDGLVVTEAWSAESPNHGVSSVVNQVELQNSWLPHGIGAWDWVNGMKLLLESKSISAPKIVAVGHSAGACVLILTTCFFPLTEIPYTSMILVEPSMMDQHLLDTLYQQPNAQKKVIEATKTRKDRWSSRDEARAWFQKRLPWKKWHPRVLDLFVENGLCDLPTAAYPDIYTGVTLACTREQEVTGYLRPENGVYSLSVLSTLCSRIPVHLILGSRIDLIPKENHDACSDISQGRKMASVSVIDGAGHQVVQEAPEEVADKILAVLHRAPLASASAKL